MKKFYYVLFLFFLFGCGSSEQEKLVGEWKLYKLTVNGEPEGINGNDFKYFFKENNEILISFNMRRNGDGKFVQVELKGSWNYDSDKKYLSWKSDGKMENKILKLRFDGSVEFIGDFKLKLEGEFVESIEGRDSFSKVILELEK